jgi:hypothetical protein
MKLTGRGWLEGVITTVIALALPAAANADPVDLPAVASDAAAAAQLTADTVGGNLGAATQTAPAPAKTRRAPVSRTSATPVRNTLGKVNSSDRTNPNGGGGRPVSQVRSKQLPGSGAAPLPGIELPPTRSSALPGGGSPGGVAITGGAGGGLPPIPPGDYQLLPAGTVPGLPTGPLRIPALVLPRLPALGGLLPAVAPFGLPPSPGTEGLLGSIFGSGRSAAWDPTRSLSTPPQPSMSSAIASSARAKVRAASLDIAHSGELAGPGSGLPTPDGQSPAPTPFGPSLSSGTSSGLALASLLLILTIFLPKAPGPGRRIRVSADLWRPLGLVSPLELPG